MYWLPTPFASFPFTSPPVRRHGPSHFNWTRPIEGGDGWVPEPAWTVFGGGGDYLLIIIIISFMQGIYTSIPETNYVPMEYSVAAILLLLFMVLISLVYYYYYYSCCHHLLYAGYLYLYS